MFGDNYECEGQINLLDYLKELEEQPGVPVEIRGICDDAICPKCGWWFLDNQTDFERCPECGQKVDWRRWHEIND